jgi:hypothetical protein
MIANDFREKNNFPEQLKQPQLILKFVGLPLGVNVEEEEEEFCLWPIFVCREIAIAK